MYKILYEEEFLNLIFEGTVETNWEQAGAAPMSNSIQINSSRCGCFNDPTQGGFIMLNTTTLFYITSNS